MGPVSGLVLYAVIWFMTLFVLLPIGLRTQGDEGKIEPGTHAGSPANLNLRRKFLQTSIIAFVVWAIIAGVIVTGLVTVDDIDMFNRMGET
ncbi:DUF1467 family protein [Anianabacter salinae]|uniref:DUF1467 family protein n=1 Tax=Anianabacter salinae TaxID=2851023 RepID=UPI00225DDBD0|nr:DUF1467 family protein [Anianabacter salinae]MBV0912638.1 DUF1467 family protein [Anianabacter salinae]